MPSVLQVTFYDILETMRQVVTVTSMDDNTLNAFPMELAGSRAGTIIRAGGFHFLQELILQSRCLLILPCLKQVHSLHFLLIAINHNSTSSLPFS